MRTSKELQCIDCNKYGMDEVSNNIWVCRGCGHKHDINIMKRELEFYRESRVVAFEKSARKLGYPKETVCFKPTIAHGARGFRVIVSPKERGKTFFSEKEDRSITLEEAKNIIRTMPIDKEKFEKSINLIKKGDV